MWKPDVPLNIHSVLAAGYFEPSTGASGIAARAGAHAWATRVWDFLLSPYQSQHDGHQISGARGRRPSAPAALPQRSLARPQRSIFGRRSLGSPGAPRAARTTPATIPQHSRNTPWAPPGGPAGARGPRADRAGNAQGAPRECYGSVAGVLRECCGPPWGPRGRPGNAS